MNRLLQDREIVSRAKDGASLRFLYNTLPGRVLLRLLSARFVSRACGCFLDSKLSKPLVPRFIARNSIQMADYLPEDYACFNDCFARRIRPELRPVDCAADALIAPCDGLLSAYRIDADTVIPAKQSRYRISDLLGGDPAANAFVGGYCLVFRLCVHHYHRYCFVDDGHALRSRSIAGQLHTVRPIALEKLPVFVRNCREYTLMETEHLGCVAQIEVGAMLVGKIDNAALPAHFRRGAEKGKFLYGGSTVILLIGPGKIDVPQTILDCAAREAEIPVRMGERLATLL